KFAFAAARDRIRSHELLVAVARMTHDQLAPSRRAQIADEIGGVITFRIECRKAGESIVGDVPPRGSLPCKASPEPGNPESLCHLHAAPQNAPRTVGAIAQPELARKSFFVETREQLGSD